MSQHPEETPSLTEGQKQPEFHGHKTDSEGDGTELGSSLWISDRLSAGTTS